MALTTTSLASAMTAKDMHFIATAATGATVGGLAKIDGEFMTITEIVGTTISVARRGDYGGLAMPHESLASCVFGLPSDLAALGKLETIPVPADFDQSTISVDGFAILAPLRNTHYWITQGAALSTCTLANPLASQNGLMVSFTGCTDFAHVITTAACHDGTTGAHTTLTSAAFIGSSITLIAWDAKWMVLKNQLWVIT